MLCGSSHPYLFDKEIDSRKDTSELSNVESLWSVLKDPLLSAIAQKMFLHIARLLCILHYVIEQLNPFVTAGKVSCKKHIVAIKVNVKC